MMSIIVRKAKNTDAPLIADLLKSLELFPHIQAKFLEAVQEQVSHNLTLCHADNSHSIYLALDPTGIILGYCAVHWLPYLMFLGPEGYISELFLKKSSRGQGIGGRLLKIVKAEAEKRGCSRLRLLNLKNRESYQRGFYKKQGWEERPEAVNFILNMQNE